MKELKAELKRQRCSASDVVGVLETNSKVVLNDDDVVDKVDRAVAPCPVSVPSTSSGLSAALAGQLPPDAVPVIFSGPAPLPPNQRLTVMAIEEIQRRPLLVPPPRIRTPPRHGQHWVGRGRTGRGRGLGRH